VTTLPLKAMAACLILLNPKAPICEDAHRRLYLCVNERCATIQSLSVEWKRHPRKQQDYLRQLYGAKE
jgi:hypothetical protein